MKLTKMYFLAMLFMFLVTMLASGTMASQAVTSEGTPTFIPIGNKSPKQLDSIKVGIDVGHNNLFNKTLFEDAFTLLNDTFAASGVRFITTRLQEATLQDLDVLIIFGPNVSYSENEVNAIKSFLNDQQKGLLVAGGFSGNESFSSAQNAINSLSKSFGIEFDYSDRIFKKANVTVAINETNTTEITVNNTVMPTANFTSPLTPVTEDLRQVLLADAVNMKVNESHLDEELVLYQRYTLLTAKGDNQTSDVPIIHALEFESSSRAMFLASYQLFNDSFVDPIEEEANSTVKTFPFVQDNTRLLNQTMQWLGHYLGYFKFNATNLFRHTTAEAENEIYKGDVVSGEVFIFDAQTETPVDGMSTTLFIERTNILDYAPMFERSSGLFWFQYNTTGLGAGGVTFNFLGEHPGYFPVVGEIGRVFIRYDEPGPAPANLSMWVLIAATTVIVGWTAFEVYRYTRTAVTTPTER